MLEKIRLYVDRIFSRLGMRPKVPLGFKLRAGHWFSFRGPRLGSKPNFLGTALEPCTGFSLGVGSFSGQIVPQECWFASGYYDGFWVCSVGTDGFYTAGDWFYIAGDVRS
jgi:hypothetical protein